LKLLSKVGDDVDVLVKVIYVYVYPSVLCNAPVRYTVPNPRGAVKEHCCVDMLVMESFHIKHVIIVDCFSVIKHRFANQGPYNTTDKFKVEIYHEERLIGSKVIVSHLKDEDNSTTEV